MPVNPIENEKEKKSDERKSEHAAEISQAADHMDATDDLLRDLKAVLATEQTEKPENAKEHAANLDSALDQTKMIQDTVKAAQKAKQEFRAAAARTAEPDAPTARFSTEAVDDESLLAEIHALIGDPVTPKPIHGSTTSPFAKPSVPRSAPIQRPLARITEDALKNVPDEYEDVAEADTMGVPGWLKGLFILLFSLLLGAMTFYAVASDVIGQVF